MLHRKRGIAFDLSMHMFITNASRLEFSIEIRVLEPAASMQTFKMQSGFQSPERYLRN